MPPPLIFDPQKYDLSKTILTREQIYEMLPHREEFMQLDGVHALDLERREIVGFRDVRADEWWAKGHVPGRPIFPGVLMVETAAHLASAFFIAATQLKRFIAFSGMDAVKFRGAVYPPARLLILAKATAVKTRRVSIDSQALVEGKLVFEGKITGMTLDPTPAQT